MNLPPGLRYSPSHKWIQPNLNGTVTIGITDYAQIHLGAITFVQLPSAGAFLRARESFGVIESVKATADMYAPISGLVLACNAEVKARPDLLNQSPYDVGWLLKLRPENHAELRQLMSEDEYYHHVQ